MDDAVTAAAIERLQEHRRRLIADKVAKGEAVLRTDAVIVITGIPCKKKIEAALKERDEQGREILYEEEPTVIITGVPRRDRCPDCDGHCVKSSEPAYDPHAYARELARRLEPAAPPPMPQPTPDPELPESARRPVRAQVRAGNGSDDGGEIAEAEFTVQGNRLNLYMRGKVVTELLRPGDDPEAIARKLLRQRCDRLGFNGPVRYWPAGIV